MKFRILTSKTEDNLSLERMQRKAARFCSNNYSATVGVAGIPMLRDLAWPSLESRRTIAGLS